jgi:Leucine-rich repeat (LRR) protein
MARKEQDRRDEGNQQSSPNNLESPTLSLPITNTHPQQNLDALQNLRIISIQSNRLTNITGVSNLPNLEELYLSHNAITDLTGLENNTALRVLDFSNNQVSHLEHLSSLKNLEELWASNNQLASFDEVERELKGKENLQTVYFEGNPLQMNGPAVYRNKVKLALPQIVQIDASMFTLLPTTRMQNVLTLLCLFQLTCGSDGFPVLGDDFYYFYLTGRGWNDSLALAFSCL